MSKECKRILRGEYFSNIDVRRILYKILFLASGQNAIEKQIANST